MAGLLEGVKVVESAVLLTGDFLGMLLADEGADVIKVESPGLGDYLREILVKLGPHNSAMHLVANRNKKSAAINLKDPAGRAAFERLIKDADVFVTGVVAQNTKALGIDYDTLRAINPGIVYCQATGFGAEGPYADIPTHGGMMNALAGGPPLRVGANGRVERASGYSATNNGEGVVIGPLYAAFAVAAGLVRRTRTGEGCYIDISCADALVATGWPGGAFIAAMNPDKVLDEGFGAAMRGDVDPDQMVSPKYTHYETKDHKFVLFCAIEWKFWEHFCRAVDRADLLEQHDAEAATDWSRGDVGLYDALQAVFHTRTMAEWTQLFSEADIAAGPALAAGDLMDDPHLTYRGVILKEDHPDVGAFWTVGNPIRVKGQTFEIRSAPSLGQHTNEVLRAYGYSDEELSEMRTAGVIA